MLSSLKTAGGVRIQLGFIEEGKLFYPICSQASNAPRIKGVKITYLYGKEEGEPVRGGKLAPGQVARIDFGSVLPKTDILVGINPALLGVAVVGNPVILQGSIKTREAFFITVEAKKAIDLEELEWHVSVAAL